MLWNAGGCKLLVDQHGLVTNQQTIEANMYPRWMSLWHTTHSHAALTARPGSADVLGAQVVLLGRVVCVDETAQGNDPKIEPAT